MLLDGVNHIAWISKDVARLGRFYADVFEAEVGETRDHGPGETMTTIRIGPHTELNIVVQDGNTEADRQTPMWHRGRIDHVGLQAASPEAFDAIRERIVAAGAGRRPGQRLRRHLQHVLPRPGRPGGRSPAAEGLRPALHDDPRPARRRSAR